MDDDQKRDCGEPKAEVLHDLVFKTEEISSIADFVRRVQRMVEKWRQEDQKNYDEDSETVLSASTLVGQVWFRGHHTCDLSLRPGLYRESTVDGILKSGAKEDRTGKKEKTYEENLFRELIEAEHELRIDFISYGHLLNQAGQATSQIDWYFLMQHHGVPTRLLDWTTNALAALFFAIEDYIGSKPDLSHTAGERDGESSQNDCAAVWMIDAYWLAKCLPSDWSAPLLPWSEDALRYVPPLEQLLEKNEISKLLIPDYPMPIEPPAMHPRVAAQEGRFIIFGKSQELLNEEIHRDRNSDCSLEEARIVQIRFRPDDAHVLLEELAQLGISKRTLFPDLGGLAEFVRWKHFHKVKSAIKL